MTKTSIENTQKLIRRGEMFEPLLEALREYFLEFGKANPECHQEKCDICTETEALIKRCKELL